MIDRYTKGSDYHLSLIKGHFMEGRTVQCTSRLASVRILLHICLPPGDGIVVSETLDIFSIQLRDIDAETCR